MADQGSNPSPAPANPDPNAEVVQRLQQLEQRYAASSEEGKRLAEENRQLRQQFEMMQEQRPAIPDRRDPYSQQLQDLGIPVDAVQGIIQREIQTAFEPIARQIQGQQQGRQRLLTSYGKDFQQYEQDVANFIQNDPEAQRTYNTLFNADPAAAMEWSFLKYSESRRRAQPTPTNGADDGSSVHAQVPTAGGGSGPRPQHDPQWDEAREAWEAWSKAPTRQNAERYAKARLGMVYTREFLDGTNRR